MDPNTQRLFIPSAGGGSDAVWFKDAATNSTAVGNPNLDVYSNANLETTWLVPVGVTSIHILCIGCGGGGHGRSTTASKSYSTGGGATLWRNSVTVTPGETLYVHAGMAGSQGGYCATLKDASSNNSANYYFNGGDRNYPPDFSSYATLYPASGPVTNYTKASYVRRPGQGAYLCYAMGGGAERDTDGGHAADSAAYVSGFPSHPTGGTGSGGTGHGLAYPGNNSWLSPPEGSGGAGGYHNNGGDGGSRTNDGTKGNNGGGGGGGGRASGYPNVGWGLGGHTYIWGEGDDGAKGEAAVDPCTGGDGSFTGTGATIPTNLGKGGGGSFDGNASLSSLDPQWWGCVRIMWDTAATGSRAFPSTNCSYPS